jgi:hypothetical protein
VILDGVANLVKPIPKPRVEVEEAKAPKKKKITIFETNKITSYTFSLSPNRFFLRHIIY